VRMVVVITICAAQLFVAGCTQTRTPSSGIQLTDQGKAMEAMLADVNQIRSFTYGAGTPRDAEGAALDLVAWSNRMAELFPPGQAAEDYVDMSPQRVHDAPIAMTAQANALLTTVRGGNRSLIGGRLDQVEQSGCGVCHLSRPR